MASLFAHWRQSHEDSFHEPLPRVGAFSTIVDNQHYICGGSGPGVNGSAVYSFNTSSELWTKKKATGTPHPGRYCGCCVFLKGDLYLFGGYDGVSYHSTLSKLSTESLRGSKRLVVSGECPMRKGSCGLVVVDGNTLCCFGGYGCSPGNLQLGSAFFKDADSENGWTNEFHLFNTTKGIWSSPDVHGDRPPPCSGFSFTKVDRDRAVLLGGKWPTVNEAEKRTAKLYEFDFRNMGITEIETLRGPEGRSAHASCCLNHGEEHPQLLMFGGLDNNNRTLDDMWLLDVNAHHWSQVPNLPNSVKGRYGHSLSATCRKPGLTEVVLFGGQCGLDSASVIAETVILSFVCSAPGSRCWKLLDFADNKTRALRKKMGDISSQAVVTQDAEILKQKLKAAELRIFELEKRNFELEEKAQESVQQAEDIQQSQQLTLTELRGKTEELEAHKCEIWRIPSNKIATTKAIGSGGWAEVLEGTIRVAVKKLHAAIVTNHNLERLNREMKLLAEVRHPNLVQFIGVVLDQTPPLIVTELLDMNLRQAYEQDHLEPGQRLPIYINVASALDYLHQRYDPIIHRDVSAPNVLLERVPSKNLWKGKLSDLGSANFQESAQTMGEGAIIYSPPEVVPQAFASDGDHTPKQTDKIDVYSYGVMLCEVTASMLPTAEKYHVMIKQVEKEHPELHQLIVKCTKKDPMDRLTMTQVLTELKNFCSL